MKKPVLIAIIVIILLLAGGYVASSKFMKPSPAPAIHTVTSPAPTNQSMMTTLKDLLASGKSQTCTYEMSGAQGMAMKGTTYISGKKMRSDFSGKTPDGKDFTGSMINDGSFIYTWSSMMPQGVKMAATVTTSVTPPAGQPDPNQYVDMNKQVSYDCKSWGTDDSKFAPPTDVNFMDMSQFTPKAMVSAAPPEQGMEKNPCGACDSMEGQQRMICRQSLRCTQ